MTIQKTKPTTSTEAFFAMERSIYKLAHKWARNHRMDVDDLISEGHIGLMEAYNRFNDKAGCAFSSYAYRWIEAMMRTRAKKNWAIYNASSGLDVSTALAEETYDMDLEESVDYDRKLSKLSSDDKAIVVARNEGYTFREIAEVLTSEGDSCTLHQVRNRYMEAIS